VKSVCGVSSNRIPAWKAGTLPLSYSRKVEPILPEMLGGVNLRCIVSNAGDSAVRCRVADRMARLQRRGPGSSGPAGEHQERDADTEQAQADEPEAQVCRAEAVA